MENHQIESENKQLRERVARLERQLSSQKRARSRVVDIFTGMVLGRSLRNAVSKFVDEAYEFKLERETLKDVIYAALHRLTRVGFVTLLLAVAPLTMAVLQTYYLKKQNEKLDFQNRRIEQQTFLQEADRRSSLVFLFDGVLANMDSELKNNPSRRLSPLLVGRIVTLSKALKPYRYLEGDTLTARQTSPERGHLLITLAASQLHPATYEQIFLAADFSFATLSNVRFDGLPMRNINLANAILEDVSLAGADLRFANFAGAALRRVSGFLKNGPLQRARLDDANFFGASLRDCDFSFCSFERGTFAGARLRNVRFGEAFFQNAKFGQVVADSVDFAGATLVNTAFSAKPAAVGAFNFLEAQMDTATLRSLTAFPVAVGLDFSAPRFWVKTDTFFVADGVPPIVQRDSLRVFKVKK